MDYIICICVLLQWNMVLNKLLMMYYLNILTTCDFLFLFSTNKYIIK